MSANVDQSWAANRLRGEGRSSRASVHVCMIIGAYPPARCGIGDYTARLCEALAQRNVKVSVITSSYLGIPRRDSGTLRVFPVIGSWHIHDALKVFRLIRRIKPDVVAFQIPHLEYRRRTFCNFLIPLVKVFRPTVRTVVTFHEMLELREITWRKALYIARVVVSVLTADAVVVVAPPYVDAIRAVIRKAWWRELRAPLYVIPVGSNIPTSGLDSDELQRLRQGINVPEHSLLLTYFGFIHPAKGFEDALDVLAASRRRGADGHLLVIGALDPGNSYHRVIVDRIARANLEAHVTVTGFVDAEKASDYLSMSDACLLPFRPGVHPKSTSLLAAKAQGIFTVTTTTGTTGYSEAENVFYSKPGQIESMVEAVKLYGGRKIRRDANQVRRTWDDVAEHHEMLYRQLL